MSTERLRQEIEIVETELRALAGLAAAREELGKHLLARLQVAIDNAKGCAILAENSLAPPLVTAARSVFESLLTTYWATLSEENAKVVLGATHREGVRLLRNMLRNKRGIIQHKVTGEDFTQEILNSPELAEARTPKKFSEIAEEAGLKKLYDVFYSILSMFSHGNATELLETVPTTLINAQIEALRVSLKAIEKIIVNYIREQRNTPLAEIGAILNISLP